MKNSATAIWRGSGKDGEGALSTDSLALNNLKYSYTTRFMNGAGTNPEELIAAAHAACFAMKLAFAFDSAGYPASSIETQCDIEVEAGVIKNSHLKLRANIKGISQEEFEELVEYSAEHCPVSKLLNASMTIEAELKEVVNS